MPLSFALIGAGGYVAPRHRPATRDTGNHLVAAADTHDAVGIQDSDAFGAEFLAKVSRYAIVGAGAVVVGDVPESVLTLGVPARQGGWVGCHGLPLGDRDATGVCACPESELRHRKDGDAALCCVGSDEDEELPEPLRKGNGHYDDIVHGRRL